MNYKQDFSTDASFDYNGPFGTETHHDRNYHGFTIEFKDFDKPILSSIEGFGAFDEANSIKTWSEFLEFLEENEKHYNPDDYYSTPINWFDSLKEDVRKRIKNEKNIQNSKLQRRDGNQKALHYKEYAK